MTFKIFFNSYKAQLKLVPGCRIEMGSQRNEIVVIQSILNMKSCHPGISFSKEKQEQYWSFWPVSGTYWRHSPHCDCRIEPWTPRSQIYSRSSKYHSNVSFTFVWGRLDFSISLFQKPDFLSWFLPFCLPWALPLISSTHNISS